jgi:hypothetical protein
LSYVRLRLAEHQHLLFPVGEFELAPCEASLAAFKRRDRLTEGFAVCRLVVEALQAWSVSTIETSICRGPTVQ